MPNPSKPTPSAEPAKKPAPDVPHPDQTLPGDLPPDKPTRPDQPERPDRPDRPDRPERPDKPTPTPLPS